MKLRLRGKHIQLFTSLSMEDWSKLGLTFDMMRTKPLKLTVDALTNDCHWLNDEDDIESFQKLFGKHPSELDNIQTGAAKSNNTEQLTVLLTPAQPAIKPASDTIIIEEYDEQPVTKSKSPLTKKQSSTKATKRAVLTN